MRLAGNVEQITMWESQMERDHEKEEDLGGWVLVEWILESGVVLTGLIWLRVRTSGGLL
jgi:hypothetical protein